MILISLIIAVAAHVHAVEIDIHQKPGKIFEVQGSFDVEASTEIAWDVLTDYENIPTFVSSMKSCHIKENRTDGTMVIEQTAVGGMFFVSKKVQILLEVKQKADSLEFLDIGRKDFWIYNGNWQVSPTIGGSHITYVLIAQPDFPAPSMLMKTVMKRGARQLLEQVRGEIKRRAQ
jgi:carbon monoxide dehydrogenase subunit G